MTTNIQDLILEAQLTSTGVFNSSGVQIPEPVPLTSAFTTAVAAAVLLTPSVLSYSGTVSGWDFVYGGPTLVSNLNKLSLLTITGEVASAFNDMSLSIKQLTVNGGVTSSFLRFKLCGNLTINGNMIGSFDNIVLKQDNECGKLILNGNIGIDTCFQTTANLQTFVLSLPIAVPPTTLVPTNATTLATYQAYYADITTDYDPCTELSDINTNIEAYFAGLVPADPFTQAVKDGMIAIIVAGYALSSTVVCFSKSQITYSSISITGTYLAQSFSMSHVTFKTLDINVDCVYNDLFLSSKLNGFCSVPVCESGFGLKTWKPAKSITFTATNLQNYAGINGFLFQYANVESEEVSNSGTFYGSIFFGARLVTSKLTYNNAIGLSGTTTLNQADAIIFDKFDFTSAPGVTSSLLDAATLRAGCIHLNGAVDVNQSNIEASKLVYRGILGTNSFLFNPRVLKVDYICFDENVHVTIFLNSSIIRAKEVVIKTDLSTSTALFEVGSLTADLLKFENGLISITPSARMGFIFDVCELQISKCKTQGIIVSNAFNGSLVEAQKLVITQDVAYSFNGTTVVGHEYKSGAALYSFADSLVVEKEFELSKVVNKCPVQQALTLNAGDPTLAPSAEMATLNAILTNVTQNAIVEYNTAFVVDVLKLSAFDRSTFTQVLFPDFVDFDIVVSTMFLEGVIPTQTAASTQFLIDAVVGLRTKAVIVNGSTIVAVLGDAKFAKLKQLKLVGTATISQIPLALLKNLQTLRYCGDTKPTEAERKLLKQYHLSC